MRVSGSGVQTAFEFDDMVEAIAAESRRLNDAVASADLDTRVPTTPDWTVRDLAHHIGKVQWFWSENVRAKNPAQRTERSSESMPPDTDLLAWLGWCTYSLLRALREAGADSPSWAWWGEPTPHTAGAVARHQAQEVAVHRWDAQRAVGSSTPLPTALATDGVPEFIEVMLGPDVRALRGAVTLNAVDIGMRWLVQSPDPAASSERTAELSATASDLVLMLYRRLPVPDSDVDGDPMLVASLLSLANTS